MTSKIKKQKLIIWLTKPTAATLASECRESINVSTAPSAIINNVSMKMGTASMARSRFNLDLVLNTLLKIDDTSDFIDCVYTLVFANSKTAAKLANFIEIGKRAEVWLIDNQPVRS
jgi:hypothetical protein